MSVFSTIFLFAAGYTHAGLQYHFECFCGSHGLFDRLGKAPDSQCNRTCSGNNEEMCGGGWRLSVYKTYSGE